MFKIVCVTDRRLCAGDFMERIAKIAAARPDALLLRAKELPAAEYLALAEQVQAICRAYQVSCVWHTYYNEETEFLHLPLPLLAQFKLPLGRRLHALGASCHSLAEAERAARLGCNYITAGHIFATGCKAGLPGRGLAWLQQICAASRLPVYAIGGINAQNIGQIKKAGAQGACLMSEFMTCAEPAALMAELRAAGADN